MGCSPRSVCKLQRCVQCSPRGYRSVVHQWKHCCRLENIWLVVMDSRETYASQYALNFTCYQRPRSIAGSGKTILRCVAHLRIPPLSIHFIGSSVVIEDIKTMSEAGSAFLAYFYFDFKDTGKQDSRALLSSLLVQLSDQSDTFCDAFFSLYTAHEQGLEQPTNHSLVKCLESMLTIAGQVPIYLIIDALDESPNDSGIPSPREMVLELVEHLVELRHPSLRLCITSRPEYDIRVVLEPLATEEVSLHDESGQKQDISDYVSSVVHSDRKMKRWRDDDKNAVIEKLTEKADGM